MPFQPGQSGNPSGGRPGSRHRQQLNGEFIAALLRDFRHGGPKAIERVRRTQPAAYLKILALLVPREHKVEHSNPLKELTDEQLEAMIEYLKTSLEAQASGSIRVIEGTIEPAAATAHAPKPKNRLMLEADTAVGPRERIPRKMRPPADEWSLRHGASSSSNGRIFRASRWILPRHRQFLQKSLNLSGAISVYLTVCWMFLCPR